LAIGHQALGYTYFETGDYEKSQAEYEEAIRFRLQTRIYPSCVKLITMALARAALAAGETDLDLPSLAHLLRTNKVKLYHGIMARYMGDILFHLGEAHFPKAEYWLGVAVREHGQQGMKWDLACDHMVFAQFMKFQGRLAEEKDHLDKSLLLFNKCGAEGWRRKLEMGWYKRTLGPSQKTSAPFV
jgi:tetratricopeptide (TPR) repeat protein